MTTREIILLLVIVLLCVGIARAFAPVGVEPHPPVVPPLYIPIRIADPQRDIHDGDTLKCDVLLPWGVTLREQTVHCLGYDAWEIDRVRQMISVGDAEIVKGKAARNALAALLATSRAMYLSPPQRGDCRAPCGRLTGYLSVVDAGGELINVWEWMRDNGHCRPEAERIGTIAAERKISSAVEQSGSSQGP